MRARPGLGDRVRHPRSRRRPVPGARQVAAERTASPVAAAVVSRALIALITSIARRERAPPPRPPPPPPGPPPPPPPPPPPAPPPAGLPASTPPQAPRPPRAVRPARRNHDRVKRPRDQGNSSNPPAREAAGRAGGGGELAVRTVTRSGRRASSRPRPARTAWPPAPGAGAAAPSRRRSRRPGRSAPRAG